MRTWIIRLLLLNVVISAIWFGLPYLKSPATQALDQQQRLLDQAARRNWPKVLEILADDYRDAWEMKREEAIATAHEVFQGFLLLDFKMESPKVTVEGKTASVRCVVKVSGTGAGFSGEVVNRLNNLREPFVFHWRKDGWKPSDWHLVGVNQTELSGGAWRPGT